MKGGLFKIDAANVKSAIVYGVMTLVAIFLLSIFQNILDVGSIFGLDWKAIVDSAVVATIPSLIIGVSLMKNFLTNKKGEFLGVTEVIPDKK
jgi:hypothetical protein